MNGLIIYYFVFFCLIFEIRCENSTHSFQNTSSLINITEINTSRWKNTSEFNVAVIVAGSLRSFIFTFESWKRYLIEPWQGNLHFFAHVIDDGENCPLFTEGLKALKSFAVTVEVGSKIQILPRDFLMEYIPPFYTQFLDKSRSANSENAKYLDIFARRSRAYELALHFQDSTQIHFHAFLILRPDTAFYEPAIPLFDWYKNLKYIKSTFNEDGLAIPWECNYHGLCDRQAFALADVMRTYLKHTWFIDVLKWSLQKDVYDESAFSKAFINSSVSVNQYFAGRRQYLTYGGIKSMLVNKKGFTSLELFHLSWLIMNNWTQINTVPAISFLTLRSEFAENYCKLGRHGFCASIKNGPLKATIQYNDHYKLDNIASPSWRCGEFYKFANKSMLLAKCSGTNYQLK